MGGVAKYLLRNPRTLVYGFLALVFLHYAYVWYQYKKAYEDLADLNAKYVQVLNEKTNIQQQLQNTFNELYLRDLEIQKHNDKILKLQRTIMSIDFNDEDYPLDPAVNDYLDGLHQAP